MPRLSHFFWIVSLLFIAGCASTPATLEQNNSSGTAGEEAYPEPDPLILSLLDSYRDSLDSVMGVPVAVVEDTLRFGQPESSLGNIVADAIRFRAGSELSRFVHIGIMGESSFKLYLNPGELTVGEVMDFMPYDNHLVILTLTGEDVFALANQVAEMGGSPVSGMRFRINNGRASGILVNSEVLDRNGSYLVATSSWAADGGDLYPALWSYKERVDLDVSMRDLFVDYFRSRRVVAPLQDGRIRR
ncbi:5'-nucleotidase C-terminal domain-containing protein [Rhodohalobacter mucosus]|uniref:5'-Nucleotidase C-terminal domain-containing protein n=1 Tax=Rhodohalobacter mucosus TaxID=2079485 RepID=A0A316TT17_9BACT|nr:5'-nucleotidase [Rhodohalobacter mucosus]PWN07727.1 hypothetical protein DDZ15_01525 [Rhodohalobacter mucosus]